MHARTLCLVLLIGCSSTAKRVAAPPSVGSPAVAPPPPAMAADTDAPKKPPATTEQKELPENAPSPGAVPLIPPAFAPSETWIHRTIDLGTARTGATLTIETLAAEGTHVRLIVERRETHTRTDDPEKLPWETAGHDTYDGALAGDLAHKFTVKLLGDSGGVTLTCTHASRPVAAASAVRVPAPNAHGACDKPGVWRPATTTQVDVLACGTSADPRDFVRSPGLETVVLAEGCGVQGRAERLMPDDPAEQPIVPPPTGSPRR